MKKHPFIRSLVKKLKAIPSYHLIDMIDYWDDFYALNLKRGKKLVDVSVLAYDKEKKSMRRQVVEYEPSLALFVPDSRPYVFYERIAAIGTQCLRPQGKIYVEFEERSADAVAEIFAKQGFKDVRITTTCKARLGGCVPKGKLRCDGQKLRKKLYAACFTLFTLLHALVYKSITHVFDKRSIPFLERHY